MMNKKELYNSVKMSLEMETEFPRYANAKACLIDILGRIDQLEEDEWVDIRDGLPKKSGWYWVTQKFDFKGEFEYQNETDYAVDKEWFDSTKNEFDFTHKYIIAWRTYKPQPYKRKEE